MNLIFTYIVTSLLIITGLLSLGREFKYTPLYILFSLLGLGLSFWQQKKQPIPYLKIAVNIVLVGLTARALFPFFIGRPKADMFTVLITTWIYFLILSTYIIYTKRDYYIIQGICLGVIVYACFYATRNPLPLLGYTALFLAFWIMALRNINLFPDTKEERSVSYTADDIWREIKVGTLLFFATVIISLPFYFLLPRFNIPLLPMDQLLRQRYSTIYADFPRRGLIAYLSRNPRDIMTEGKESGGQTPSPAEKGGTESQLDIRQEIKKPVFWHGEKPADILLDEIKQTNQQLQDLAKQKKKQDLVKEAQRINRQKQELQKKLRQAQDEYAKLAQAKAKLSAESPQDAAAVKNLEDNLERAESQIEALADELKNLDAQLQKQEEEPTNMEKYLQQGQRLLEQEQAINSKKEELQRALQGQNNPDQREAIENKIRESWASLQKIRDAQEQLRALAQQESAAIGARALQLWEAKEAQERQLLASEGGPGKDEEALKKEAEIEKLEQKIREINAELRELAQQDNLPMVPKYIQEHQALLEEEQEINKRGKSLDAALEKTRQEYLAMAQVQANPPQKIIGNATALKEIEDKMQDSETKIGKIVNERRAMDKRLDKIKEIMAEVRQAVYQQSASSTQKIRILWDKKEEQQQQLRKLKEETKPPPAEEETQKEEEIKPKPVPPAVQKVRQVTILDLLLYILIIATVIYIIRSLLAFILPYLKHRRRILRASRERQYNLSVSLIYNFVGRVLFIFGYRYPVVILPEEYLKAVNKRFAAISYYTRELTELFIEARYSSHQLNLEQEKRAFESYRNILQELKNSGAKWQRQILKIRFLFEL